MNDILASQLRAILDLAAQHAGVHVSENAPAVPEYITTNNVFTIDSVVAKRYESKDAYRVETGILERARLFTFEIPELLFTHQSNEFGYWNLMSRAHGTPLISSQPGSSELHALVELMIAALVEFEERSTEMLAAPPFIWRWQDSVRPLLTSLMHVRKSDAAKVLVRVASECDQLVKNIDAVPCFDLFARNVIWNISDEKLHVTFVDFDKANRLVPAGEQLSHIAVIPCLREAMHHAVSSYASLSGRPFESVKRISDISCFFRALSGVRDSMPRNLTSGSLDPYADERRNVFHESVAEAERHAAVISAVAIGGKAIEDDLKLLLSDLRSLGSAGRSR